MKVGRLSPVVMLGELNHYPTRYRKAFALFVFSVRRFPMPCGYGFIPIPIAIADGGRERRAYTFHINNKYCGFRLILSAG